MDCELYGHECEQFEWISVEDRLPEYKSGSFLVYYKNQPPLILICFTNIHGNYVIAGSNGNISGFGDYPKFSHWMPLPEPPNP